jgi:hypothetical protein
MSSLSSINDPVQPVYRWYCPHLKCVTNSSHISEVAVSTQKFCGRGLAASILVLFAPVVCSRYHCIPWEDARGLDARGRILTDLLRL